MMLVLHGLCRMSNGKRERYSATSISLRLDLWLEVIVAMLEFLRIVTRELLSI